jgi:O-antigen/teichoic acid export membrane protein
MANTLAIGIVYGRIGGPAAYGVFQFALAATVVAGVVGLSGSTTAATWAAAHGRLAAWPLFRARLRYCFVAAAGLAIVGGIVVGLGNPQLGLALGAGAATLPMFIGGDVYAAQLLGLRRYREYFHFHVALQTSTAIVVTVAVLLAPSQPWLAMLGFGATNAVLNGVGLVRVRRAALVADEDFHYARRYTEIAALGAVQARLDVLVAGAVLGAYETGLVAVARVFPMFGRRLLDIVQAPFFVELTKLPASNAAPYIRRWRFRVAGMVAASSAVGVVAAPVLLPAVYGQPFSESVPLAQLLLVAAALTSIGLLDEIMLKAHAAFRLIMVIRFVVPAIVFVSLPVLVFFFGIIGVGMSALLTAVVHAPLAVWLARRHRTTVS